MRRIGWCRRLVASAVVVLVGAGCGSEGSAGSRTASPTPASSAATSVAMTEPAVPTFDEMLARVRTALVQPGKTVHVRMDVRTEDPAGAGTRDATVDAWVDPTLPLVRVEHGKGTATGSEVTILDSASGMNAEDPAVVELLRLLATQPGGAPPLVPPGGVTMHPDVVEGRPVIVSEFLFPPVDESQAQSVSLAFDTDGRPLNEVRRPYGGDLEWTKTITYQVDFVDPATLPDDFWQGLDVARLARAGPAGGVARS